ncbi:MAG: 2-oxoacid:acceptor oxidoreductase subunit alpha [Deltaproteobacteria bacterium]|nr:2-oxoacid:acceptor oxidoreductase subunit alpha [Deltaproteobacteria bacterium]
MNTEHEIHLALIGSGGDGVMATAAMLIRTAARIGLYGMMTQSYGPQIRGGESAAHVTIGREPIGVVGRTKDLVVCFRFADVARFVRELDVTTHSAILHGQETQPMPELLQAAGGPKVAIDFGALLERAGLPELTKNVLLYGVLLRTLGWDLAIGQACVEEVFGHKSSGVISTNLRALELGYRELEAITLPWRAPRPAEHTAPRSVLSGNEACARAAVAAGCRFYAGYPITPSSEVLEEMTDLLPTVGGRLVQAEDEMAALGMVIGASYGGVPAMTATSGPGLSLMSELLGLSSMAEIPLVIVNCQRAGPSTGIPSQTEQSDLWHAVYGGHGDFPRVVLAPTDVTHCYPTMFRAFYCAETYQLPVLVLSDASIAQRSEIIDPVSTDALPRGTRRTAQPAPGESFLRFNLQDLECADGVSACAIPGTPGGMHSIAGIEHTERGTPSSDGALHQTMSRKRFAKLAAVAKVSAAWCSSYGRTTAPRAVIAWGSSAGVVRQYVATHPDTALFVPEILHPFPIDALRAFLHGRQQVSVVEMNYQGQLHHHLRALGAIDTSARRLGRAGGLPFQLREVEEWLG